MKSEMNRVSFSRKISGFASTTCFKDSLPPPVYVFWCVCIAVQIHSWFSIMFHWSPCLPLHQFDGIYLPVALKYTLKSDNVIPPVMFFWIRIVLNICVLLCFHVNVRFFLFSISMKTFIGIMFELNLQTVFCHLALEKAPHRHMYLNSWCPVSGIVWEVLGVMVLLE